MRKYIKILVFLLLSKVASAAVLTFPVGTTYKFSPGVASSGLNVGSYTGNPSTLFNGDIWYNSNTNSLNAHINGSTVSLGVIPRTNLNAGTSLVIGSAYYDTLSSNRSITFSGTPIDGQNISLKLVVSNAPILTIPSCKRAGEADVAITSIILYPGVHTLTWTYINSEWILNDSVGILNKTDATTAPTTGDDVGDGYSIGSVWIDATNDKAYICVDATSTAAVWKQTGGAQTSAQFAADISDETGTGSVVLASNGQRSLTASPGGADDTYAGNTFGGLNNSGGVTQWDVVYLNSSSQWVLADANGSGTFPARGLAVSTAATGNATTVIEDGVVRNDAWTWTPGGTVFLSTTAGGLTQTAPSTTGDKVQVIGYAIDADTLRVKISPDYGTAP